MHAQAGQYRVRVEPLDLRKGRQETCALGIYGKAGRHLTMVSVHGPHVPLLSRSRFMAMVKAMDGITRSKDRIQWPGLGAAVWTRLLFLYDVLETLSRILESFMLMMMILPLLHLSCMSYLFCFRPLSCPLRGKTSECVSVSACPHPVSHKILNKI